MAITAAAGPLSNLILAFLGALLYLLTERAAEAIILPGTPDFLFYFFFYLSYFFLLFHLLNLSLFVFNLIPLPPLDGSRILYVFLPTRIYFGVMKYERIIQICLLICLWVGAFTGLLSDAINLLSSFIFRCFAWIPFFA